MLPAPTVADLAAFTGRDPETYSDHITAVIGQATLLFTLVTGLTAMPDDPDQAARAQYDTLEMADRIYLESDYAEYAASPFQSETIASYSYSLKSPTAIKARLGGDTGLSWWDLALDKLSAKGMSLTASGSIGGGFEDQLGQNDAGRRGIRLPADDIDPPYIRIS